MLPTKYYKGYDYVYNGDIDLLITQKNFFDLHIKQFSKNELCIVNVIRIGKRGHRSGLHFICVKDYIKNTDIKPINLIGVIFSHIKL